MIRIIPPAVSRAFSSPFLRTRTVGVCIVAVSVVVSGCMSKDPYTREEKPSSATTGAVLGAIAGSLLGAAAASKNDRKKGLLIGAGVGAIAGGGVGHYMDRQEQKLRQQLEDTGVSVARDGDNIILNMPSNITFDFDSYQIKSQFHSTLNSVVLVLKEYKSTLITVIGHTDSVGADQYNQQLSEKRALAVGDYLVNNGVQKQRMAAMGKGESQPIADNSTEAGRAKNRRVELMLEPVTAD